MKALLFVLLIVFSSLSYGQKAIDLKPRAKIGLCLSGGGAKGLAHIGILKLIDSLGIKIDYITGTSMGSVIGGLYASGYTGNQIDSIAQTADWEIILNQYVPADNINMDEKDEYNKYIAEIPFVKKHFNFTGVIDGQSLQETLTRLTRHVNNITDFNKLPIPYKCMAVDILTMRPIELDSGNLALAMRCSMSIPTVFKPVKWNDYLLVDGGLMVNFPVKQLQAMGANFIIGSYTGGRLMHEDELTTINKLLIQSSSFYGIQEAKDDIEACNIFNNLTTNMLEFNAGDFKYAKNIIEKGIAVVELVRPQLINLAKQYHTLNGAYSRPKLMDTNPQFLVRTIFIEGVTSAETEEFILKRLNLKPGDSTTFEDLDHSIIDAYSNRYFSKVYYTVTEDSIKGADIKLQVIEDFKHVFKGSVHYDTEYGAGVFLNYTGRNVLGKNSRIVLSVDLAESLKFRVNYRKYIRASRFSTFTSFYNESIKQKFFTSSGGLEDTYKNKYNMLSTALSYNINVQSSAAIGVMYEVSTLKPLFDDQTLDQVHPRKIDGNIFSTFLNYQRNTYTSLYYPIKGSNLVFENRFTLLSDEEIKSEYSTLDTIANKIVKQSVKDRARFNPSYRVSFIFEKYFKIIPRLSLVTTLKTGFVFDQIFKIKNTSSTPTLENETSFAEYFSIGGINTTSRTGAIDLWGYRNGEIGSKAFYTLRFGPQWEVIHKLFVTPYVNILYSTSSIEDFGKNIQHAFDYSKKDPLKTYDYTSTIGFGINVRFKTILGPINLNISKISSFSKPTAFLSIGYYF
ncbi:patatin-like phospholipase family protein [Fluviicola taffensis]|uniref:Patatin n=1 Tax=Fluviicola taffensis (strain DSM 16823 / NCIMB 13979 / RW262) TaxID=755732 RepID=F2IG68_FLUTR|nr:patatin-like phospholipase family protein [Fluviicola taffensis]AEA44703.1 Patatin [Fluviicola taffensis DSM 16823]